ncbi:V4R domain protein [mine drainage metagenome]|uniref:V4R domain protein n=1 Tax=mine drainage metagenome TaxID=410659 RepID=T0ZKA8_9ZZZZ
MRWVKVSQEELAKIKDLYEGVMSHACHGLFFREGAVLGADLADEGLHDRTRYFPTVADMLKSRGWVEDIQFSDQAITARGSVEVVQSDIPTCHRLRGIIREVYERYRGTRVNCTEEECASLGKDQCKFIIEEI